MATSAPSPLSAAPLNPRAGATTGPGRPADAASAFAPLLEQAGQSNAPASPVALASDQAMDDAPAVPDQPSPTASLQQSPPLPLLAPSQPQSAVGVANSQPQNASRGTGIKPGDKKAGSDAVDQAALLTPGPTPAAAPPLPPAPPATTAIAIPTSVNGGSSTAASARSALSNSSRMAGQTVPATQAGLSADDAETDDATPAAARTPSQQAVVAAGANGDANPLALPVATTLPQLAGMASLPAANGPIAATRGGAAPPARPSPDGPSQPAGPIDPVTNLLPPSPASNADVQTLTASAAAIAPLAAGTIAPTRLTPSAPEAVSPATQVARAIVEPVKVVLASPAQTGPTTPHVTTIQITPVELGRVEVRIERTSDGPAKIQLIAERPETLSRLVHDQSQLQQALDQVGIPQNSRTIEFSLAPATTAGSALSSGFSGNNTPGDGASGNGSQRQNNAYYQQPSNDPDGSIIASTTQLQILRTGINITA